MLQRMDGNGWIASGWTLTLAGWKMDPLKMYLLFKNGGFPLKNDGLKMILSFWDDFFFLFSGAMLNFGGVASGLDPNMARASLE